MKVVYHLGVHKTGTTLLQQSLAVNTGQLRDHGVYFLNAEWPDGLKRLRRRMRGLQKHLNDGVPTEGDVARLGELNGRLLRRASASGAKLLLISEENLLGVTVHRELAWGNDPARFYPSAGENLAGLTTGLSPGDITAILYTRSLDSLLLGFYSEAVRHLETAEDYAGFLDRVDIPSFRFDDLLARLQASRPCIDIRVKPFEAIRAGVAAFVGDLLSECGVHPDGIEVPSEKVHKGLDTRQIEVLRELAVRKAAGETGRQFNKQHKAALALPGEGSRPRLADRHVALVRSAMAGDIAERLAADWETA